MKNTAFEKALVIIALMEQLDTVDQLSTICTCIDNMSAGSGMKSEDIADMISQMVGKINEEHGRLEKSTASGVKVVIKTTEKEDD